MEDSKAVVVGLYGGLGNQMFQYAAGRSLSLRLGKSLKLDVSWFLGRTDRSYALKPFMIGGEVSVGMPLLPNIINYHQSRLSRRWLSKRMGAPIFREKHFHFDEEFDHIDSAVYLEGYWQSELYFRYHRKEIARDFELKDEIPDNCKHILGQIKSNESIGVHVRRGDYLTDPKAAKLHGVCSVDYYQRGIEQLMATVDQPHCFIFSDEPDWARRSLSFPCPTTIVDVNLGNGAHWDLYLMAACKHFVIANSSFSWWGAWLGKAEDKRVIAPLNWFISNEKSTKDLLPQAWKCI